MTSVGSIVGGAFGLVRRHPLPVLVWGLLYLAGLVGFSFAMRPMLAMQMDMMTAKTRSPQELQALILNMQAVMGPILLAELGFFILAVVLFNASQRAVLRPEERGFAFLRLGMDELRVVGLGLFMAVAFYFAFFICILVLGLLTAIVAAASQSAVATIVFVLIDMVVAMGALIYFQVRLSLAFPLTVLRREFIIGEAWRLSRGRFWTLFGGYFVVWLVYLVLAVAFAAVIFAPYVSELMQNGITADSMRNAAQHQLARQTTIDAMTVLTWTLGAALGGLGIALFGGAVATAARDLTAGGQGVAGTFG